jgi:hypothetical protein
MPRFGVDVCETDERREFLESLHAIAEAHGWYGDGWERDDRFIVTVCPCDPEHNCVLRTLRVDFFRGSVAVGADETHQLVTDLDPRRPEVQVVRDQPVAALAKVAADWLEREMSRQIIRQEWIRPEFTHRRWLKRVAAESLHESEHRWFLLPVLFAVVGLGTSQYLHFPRWVGYGAAFAFFILGSLLLAVFTSPESVTVEKEKSDSFDHSVADDYGLGKPLVRLSLWLAEWARRQLSKRK